MFTQTTLCVGYYWPDLASRTLLLVAESQYIS